MKYMQVKKILMFQCGVSFIFHGFGVSMRQGQREYFYHTLDCLYPGMKAKYIEHFANTYECLLTDYKRMLELFCSACEDYKLYYKIADIFAGARSGVAYKQISLFKGWV